MRIKNETEHLRALRGLRGEKMNPRKSVKSVVAVFLLLVAMAAGVPQNCHNLDTTTALQDFVQRWLAEENGTDLWHFNILARRWQDPNFISLNPCITFTIKSDVNLTANFEPSALEQAAEMLKEMMN